MQNLRIYIVEDDLEFCEDLTRHLSDLNYSVVGTFSSAQDAFWQFKQVDVDLVLIDILLPNSEDGVALARWLREEQSIAILFVTGLKDKANIDRARSVHPDGYLIKPVSRETLYSAIELAIANRAQADSHLRTAIPEKSSDDSVFSEYVTEQLKLHIDRSFSKQITTDELSKIGGVTRYHFVRKFKNTFGTTPHQYVVDQRIDEAKRLLSQTDWTIGQVAEAVGYQHQAHFSTAFKSRVGMNPRRYRST